MAKRFDDKNWEERQVVTYVCENAPRKVSYDSDGHTVYKIDYHGVNGRGAAWASHMRLRTCEKCGGDVVHERDWERDHLNS